MTDIEEIARAMAEKATARLADGAMQASAVEFSWHDFVPHVQAILPILDRRIAEARKAGAAEMQERCAGVAERHNAATAVIAPKIRSLT